MKLCVSTFLNGFKCYFTSTSSWYWLGRRGDVPAG